MKRHLARTAAAAVVTVALGGCAATTEAADMEQTKPEPTRGAELARITWLEAEELFAADPVVVIPIGAACKEHGPHLPLGNDWTIAEYLKRRVLRAADVVVAPTVGYHYYPAFTEYPGSATLRLETARDLIVDICRSFAGQGARRFYVLNTGVSTLRALEPAAEALAAEGILMRYTDIIGTMSPVEKELCEQEGGTHADEVETSMMLYMAPETCDMSKAVKDYHPDGGALTRVKGAKGTYSPTGVWGDATLATREKGERLVEALVAGVLADIEAMKTAELPAGK